MPRGRSRRGQRDDNFPSLAELLDPPDDPVAPVRPLSPIQQIQRGPLYEIEDARRYSPERYAHQSSRTITGNPARANRVPSQARGLSALVGFNDPNHTIRCVRRKQRREVIFAKRKRKKGAGASRRRFNFWSTVKC